MTELPTDARSALDMLSAAHEPDAEAPARVRALLDQRLAAEPSPSSPSSARWFRWAAGASGVMVVCLGLWSLSHRTPVPQNPPRTPTAVVPRAAVSARVAPVAAVPSAPAAVAVVAPSVVEVARPREPIERPIVSHRRPAPQGSGDELDRVIEANQLYRGGDPTRALARVDALRTSFPRGAHVEEREALRVLCLCALGRVVEAGLGARRFLETWPTSPQAPRVRASCGVSR